VAVCEVFGWGAGVFVPQYGLPFYEPMDAGLKRPVVGLLDFTLSICRAFLSQLYSWFSYRGLTGTKKGGCSLLGYDFINCQH